MGFDLDISEYHPGLSSYRAMLAEMETLYQEPLRATLSRNVTHSTKKTSQSQVKKYY